MLITNNNIYDTIKKFHKMLEKYEDNYNIYYIPFGGNKVLRIDNSNDVTIERSYDYIYLKYNIKLDIDTDFPYKNIMIEGNYELYCQIVNEFLGLDLNIFPLRAGNITLSKLSSDKYVNTIKLIFPMKKFFKYINDKIITTDDKILKLIKRYTYIINNELQNSEIPLNINIDNYTIKVVSTGEIFIEYIYKIMNDFTLFHTYEYGDSSLIILNLDAFLEHIKNSDFISNVNCSIKYKDNKHIITIIFDNIFNDMYYKNIWYERYKSVRHITVDNLFCPITYIDV